VLIAFFADPKTAASDVLAGESLGMTLIVLASYLAVLGLVVVAADWVRYLGFIPIAIGLVRFVALLRPPRDDAELAGRRRAANVLIVTATVLGNGGDNLATYISLFANLPQLRILVTVLTFAALTALWCGLAYVLVGRGKARRQVQRWGRRALPFVMIGLGLRILIG